MNTLSFGQATRDKFCFETVWPALAFSNPKKFARLGTAVLSVLNFALLAALVPHPLHDGKLLAAATAAAGVSILAWRYSSPGASEPAVLPSAPPRCPSLSSKNRDFPFARLLNHEELRLEDHDARLLVEDQVVCVTGAGGSIGSALCQELASANPRKLLLLDKSENSLFYTHRACAPVAGPNRVVPLLIDILDYPHLLEIFGRQRPQVVFHAAAHKHVGMLERCPEEALRNNVLGTRNVALAVLANEARHFVNISTDKAVAPTNYMGLSKKLAESLVRELSAYALGQKTRFANVRFGNVAGTTGSVMRLFLDQIRSGGPVSVTDPRATRYFMSIREAVYLIVHAAILGRGGETFIFDMGEPLSIYEIARSMICLEGLRPGSDVEIDFTGLGPGEKLVESLWEAYEQPRATSADRVLAIRSGTAASLNVVAQVDAMERHLLNGDISSLLAIAHSLIPEFVSKKDVPDSFSPKYSVAEVA